MCENRHGRLRIKGRAMVRARAARRIERIAHRTSIESAPPSPTPPSPASLNSSTSSDSNQSTSPVAASSAGITKPRVNRELMAIALRTMELLRTNRELQIRMDDLRRETTDFIIDVMNNPENAEAKAQMIAAQKRLSNESETTTDKTAQDKVFEPHGNLKPQVD